MKLYVGGRPAFFNVFSNFKKHDFLRFFELLHTFSRTLANARDFKVLHGSAMRSLSLVMSECFLSGRGQGHVSNFYTVDLENFSTASHLYTIDIHNSTVIVLLWHPYDNESDSIASLLSAHVYYTSAHLNPPTSLLRFVQDLSYKSFCTVSWQLARFQLTWCIARSLGDS